MTTYLERTATEVREPVVRARKPGSLVIRWITSTDHKVIGYLYLMTSFGFFLIGGVMALLIRAQLFTPQSGLVTDGFYNQLFTMHGTIMLLLFATPLFIGFANVIMPLQIGSPDVAFPRLNMFSYCLFLFGGLIAVLGLHHPGRRGRLRLVGLRPAEQLDLHPAGRWRPVGVGAGTGWFRHHPRRRQLHHDDHLHASPRHDDVPDADLHVEHPGHQHSGDHGLPAARCGPVRTLCRPELRHPHIRPVERRCRPFAASVLVLRAP